MALWSSFGYLEKTNDATLFLKVLFTKLEFKGVDLLKTSKEEWEERFESEEEFDYEELMEQLSWEELGSIDKNESFVFELHDDIALTRSQFVYKENHNISIDGCSGESGGLTLNKVFEKKGAQQQDFLDLFEFYNKLRQENRVMELFLCQKQLK